MNLSATILENQKSGFLGRNNALIRTKLRDLVFEYVPEVIEVLHKCGIPVSSVLPKNVILAVVVKHLNKNALLRETIAKMILESGDEFHRADGQGLAVIGGALSTVGTILAGIGRGQTGTTDTSATQAAIQAQQIQQQQQQIQADQKRRTTWVVIGISTVLLIGAILLLRSLGKASQVKVIPQIG